MRREREARKMRDAFSAMMEYAGGRVSPANAVEF